MRLLLAACALSFLIPASGCRDAIVDPLPNDPVDDPSEGPDAVDGAEFYLKGPDTLYYGETAQFRIGPNPGSAGYGWSFREITSLSGDAQLLEVASPSARITEMTARAYGSALLVGTHYDVDGRVIGEGRRRVHVIAR